MSEQGYPAPRAAWGMVALLTVAYLFSYIDRTVLGLLVEPIKADFALSDAQIGLLLGPAFAIFYATMGLPLGWLVDRKSRTRLIAAGVVIWSLATAASGLARSFTQLFLVRMTVGVGEAVLSPAAFSIIGDSFPPERRARPIAAYSMAITLSNTAGQFTTPIMVVTPGATYSVPFNLVRGTYLDAAGATVSAVTPVSIDTYNFTFTVPTGTNVLYVQLQGDKG